MTVQEPAINWKEAVKPVRDQYYLSYKCGVKSVLSPDDSEVLYKLLDDMSEKLDSRKAIRDTIIKYLLKVWLAGFITGSLFATFILAALFK